MRYFENFNLLIVHIALIIVNIIADVYYFSKFGYEIIMNAVRITRAVRNRAKSKKQSTRDVIRNSREVEAAINDVDEDLELGTV